MDSHNFGAAGAKSQLLHPINMQDCGCSTVQVICQRQNPPAPVAGCWVQEFFVQTGTCTTEKKKKSKVKHGCRIQEYNKTKCYLFIHVQMFFESKNNLLYLFQYIPKNEFIKDNKKFLQ